ncbi:MAG: hypothetical protein RL499_487 [Actinomycetota bacterium]|jgi:hypothetical protein
MEVVEPPILPFVFLPIVSNVIAIVVVVGVFALVMRVLYSVVWRAVRRGLEEYYGPGEYRGFTPPLPSEHQPIEPPSGERRHRTGASLGECASRGTCRERHIASTAILFLLSPAEGRREPSTACAASLTHSAA